MGKKQNKTKQKKLLEKESHKEEKPENDENNVDFGGIPDDLDLRRNMGCGG